MHLRRRYRVAYESQLLAISPSRTRIESPRTTISTGEVVVNDVWYEEGNRRKVVDPALVAPVSCAKNEWTDSVLFVGVSAIKLSYCRSYISSQTKRTESAAIRPFSNVL